MRRTASSVAIVACALSFLVVCLGACFAPAEAAEHGCCQGEEGWQAPDTDCCSVVPAVSANSAAVASAPAPIVVAALPAFLAPAPLLTAPGVVTTAPSPPLVLRI
jgi:hypothetical protein